MIRNKEEYNLYRKADKIIAGKEITSFKGFIRQLILPDPIDRFMFLLRICEYYKNCSNSFLDKVMFTIYYLKFKKHSKLLGFSIPLNVFGPGLLIPHYGTIVINRNALFGKCCVLHTCVCVAGDKKKQIGDFVYLSTGVTITGGIDIAHNVTIGANSLVNKSNSEECTFLGGVPALIIKKREPWYICDGAIYKNRVERIISLFEK